MSGLVLRCDHHAVLCACALLLMTASLSGCGGSPEPKPKPHKDDSRNVKLSNGVVMPVLAAGTWKYNDTVAEKAVVAALKVGFKHIDTAHDYNNQVGVGKGLKASGVKREDVFITSKIPGCGLQGLAADDCYNNTLKAIREDLTQLDVKYLDLILLHFPPCLQDGDTCHSQKTGCSNSDNLNAVAPQWRAMEAAYKQGLVKAVGVSNYCRKCFEVLGNTSVKPMVNQFQMHVGMGKDPQGFLSYAKTNNMVAQAWSPLGCGETEILTGKVTTEIAKAHGKSTAQVALKWLQYHGLAIATKSSSETHLAEDLDIFDWELTDDEMKSLDDAGFSKDTPSFLCADPDPKAEEIVLA